MALILATTTVTVSRSAAVQDKDPTDPDYPDPSAIQTGLRATIGTPTATATEAGGTRVLYTAPFSTDPADIQPRDTLTDADGNVWVVDSAKQTGAFGLAMVVGRCYQVAGAD